MANPFCPDLGLSPGSQPVVIAISIKNLIFVFILFNLKEKLRDQKHFFSLETFKHILHVYLSHN